MAVLAAPALNWLGSPEPQSATSSVDPDSIQPYFINLGVLPAPRAGQQGAGLVSAATNEPYIFSQGTALPAPQMGSGGGGTQSIGYAS